MGSLIFNFLKRAVIVPAVITGIVLAVFLMRMPSQIASSKERFVQTEASDISLSDFSTVSFTAFSQLTDGDYVGTVKCDSIGMAERPIVYNTLNKAFIYLDARSTEPWDNGCVILWGENNAAQLLNLHSAKIADTFEVSFYENESRSYSLQKIVTNVTEDEIYDYSEADTLLLILPYNDFSALGESRLYTIYIAK